MRKYRIPISGAITAAAAAAILLVPQLGSATNVAAVNGAQTGDPSYVYRIDSSAGQSEKLFADGFDVLEQRDGKDLFVLGTKGDGDRLRGFGFSPTVESVLPAPQWAPVPKRADNDPLVPADVNETYDGGYHTVNAQYAHLDQVATQHPDLATNVTYGKSWRKNRGLTGGYDLRAICITKKKSGDCALNPNSAKPRFFLMSQIHAREITTGDVSWRWIDYLVNGYGTDSTVTSLLNSTELWVVPIANPDGVDIVQKGGNSPILQRKNADYLNGNNCGVSAYSQAGVDLNRNTGSHWDTSGISHDPCSQVYDGPRSDSEIENTALEGLFRNLYPAVRGSGNSAPAPPDTKGVMITMHSDASMVLFPWEYDYTVHTGNDAALRAMGKAMGSITGYQYGQAGEILYNASGGTDDWTYDKLGVASFTIEVGDNTGRGCSGFTPRFSCQASFFWPKMKPALVYAAQHALTPYRTK
ncbi:carboxypeptidase [Solihabitans fulvus]|uniref:Zinc carboxypeptidase n=1 Tax=Solihabitans fulvus TaxID=1892852 RepID=A0A5B2WHU9_9PSEU|nr:M14 family zinc carboxypeptidase [Solihabitans fulvus]KAA2250965.1 carboxypeptidase [Solihabitans fulvus]